MPNFWSLAKQNIYELFVGPRTKDFEFDKKIEELKKVNASVSQFQNFYNTFHKNTKVFVTFNMDISHHLNDVYDSESVYSKTIDKIIDVHQQARLRYHDLIVKINSIQEVGFFWDNQYIEVWNAIEKREQARKTYDHYDEKLEMLVKKRNDKLSKGEAETLQEIEHFESNEQKFTKSAEEYIKISYFAYHYMCDMIDYKNNYINPSIVIFVNAERKFYKKMSKLFETLNKLEFEMNDLDLKREVPKIEYDPFKYIRGQHLLNKNNLNILKEIKSLKFLRPDRIELKPDKEMIPNYSTEEFKGIPFIKSNSEEFNPEHFIAQTKLEENIMYPFKPEIASNFSYISPHFDPIQMYDTNPTEESERIDHNDSNLPRYHSPKLHAEKKSPELTSKKRYIV